MNSLDATFITVLTLVYYGLRNGEIRCLAKTA